MALRENSALALTRLPSLNKVHYYYYNYNHYYDYYYYYYYSLNVQHIYYTDKIAIIGASKMQHVIDPMLNGMVKPLCNQHGTQNIL